MCSYCGKAMKTGVTTGFNEVCAECGKDLHACVNCVFYSPGRRWDCAETIDDPVVDKDRRNHCDHYRTNPTLFSDGPGQVSRRSGAEDARRGFDRLFGG